MQCGMNVFGCSVMKLRLSQNMHTVEKLMVRGFNLIVSKIQGMEGMYRL